MDPRRTLIADAALQVIADKGIRGLTHLAVDAQAELPKGSTSYYCRKRVDLLRLTLQRLFMLDKVDMTTAAAELTEGAPHPEAHVADSVAAVIERWLTPPTRSRTVARLELFLAVAHDPELRDLNGEHMASVVELALAVGAATDPPTSTQQVAATLMMADGLMMAVVRQNLPTPPKADIARLVGSILGADVTGQAPFEQFEPDAVRAAAQTGEPDASPS